MTIILPTNYHAQKALEQNRVICVSPIQAVKSDIRALRIGILNIMPKAKSYEFSLLHPLGRSILQINPVWIRLQSHKYKSTEKSHLEEIYQSFEEAIKDEPLDGLIITGAPVELLEFEAVDYWTELKELLDFSYKNIPSTMGICWGAMALAKYLGIDKKNYPKKLFGLFETINLNHDHAITGSLDDRFWLPNSRFAGYDDARLEEAEKAGIIKLLAKCVGYDYCLFESANEKFIMNLGHLEYDPIRIAIEYERDKSNELIPMPINFDFEKQDNIWRCQRNEFFQQWIRFCHEKTHMQTTNI